MDIKEDNKAFLVKFMVHEEGDNKDVYAYFPFSNENNGCKTCYSHIGQHSVCSSGYIFNSRAAKVEEYNDLYEEMTKMVGYELRVHRNNLISFKDIIDKKIAVKCDLKEDAHRLLIEIGRANYSDQFKTDRAGLGDIFNVFYVCWDPKHADTYNFISKETDYLDKIGYALNSYYKREGYVVINSNLVIK